MPTGDTYTTPDDWSTLSPLAADRLQKLAEGVHFLFLRPGNSRAKRYVPGAGKTTASTSWVDVDGATAEVTLVKRAAATDLELQVACEAFLTGAAGTIEFGLLIGGTTYDVARHSYQNLSVYHHVGGVAQVAGLAAGTYTARLRWKVSAGTATIDGGGQISFRVAETAG